MASEKVKNHVNMKIMSSFSCVLLCFLQSLHSVIQCNMREVEITVPSLKFNSSLDTKKVGDDINCQID